MTIQRRTREEMLTEVIRMFGFEDERTIDFAAKCEEWLKKKIKKISKNY